MKARTIVLLLCVTLPLGAGGRELSRGGVVFPIPDGDWKELVGICTGDTVLSRDGISVLVGTRHYQEKTSPDSSPHHLTVSTADLYQLHGFEDLPKEVRTVIEDCGGRVLKTDFLEGPADRSVLVIEAEFDVDPTKEDGGPVRWHFAFVEDPEHKSATEFRCDYSPSEAVLAKKIFEDVLTSMAEAPIQSPEPTTARAAVGRSVVLQANPTFRSLAVAAQR